METYRVRSLDMKLTLLKDQSLPRVQEAYRTREKALLVSINRPWAQLGYSSIAGRQVSGFSLLTDDNLDEDSGLKPAEIQDTSTVVGERLTRLDSMLETKQLEGGILLDQLANSKASLVERCREEEKYANGLASQESNFRKEGDSSVVIDKPRKQEETDPFFDSKAS